MISHQSVIKLIIFLLRVDNQTTNRRNTRQKH